MGKYLKLRFEGAGVFPFYEIKGKLVKRQLEGGTIGVNQVSNMLHVLANKRPIKSFPRSYGDKATPDCSHLFLERNNTIFNMAKNSYVKIDNIFRQYKSDYKNLENANPYYSEFIHLSKNVLDSYAHKTVSVNENWGLLKNYMDNEYLFDELIKCLGGFLNKDVLNYRKTDIFNAAVELSPFKLTKYVKKDVIKDMVIEFNHPLKKIITELIDNKKTPVAQQLLGDDKAVTTTREKNLLTTVLNRNGIDKISKLSGNLIVYVNDWYENQIRSGKGCATLLDDGIVFIEGIVDEDYFLSSELDGFVELIKLKEHEDNSKIIKE